MKQPIKKNWLACLRILSVATAMVMTATGGNTMAATTAQINPKLDAELAAVVNDPALPLASLSVLTVRGGKIVYHQQFGNRFIDPANPANNKRANQETLYRIASISKFVTTLGVMKLVEDSKLALDEDVSTYLGYQLRNPNFPDTPITLRMMLSHRSSLRDDAGYYWEAKLNVDLKDVLVPGGKLYGKGEAWAKTGKPGEYFEYANFPWGVIGTIMERATGERFDRLMQRLIFTPMRLHGGFHPVDFPASDVTNIATLYRKRTEVDGKEIWNPAGPWIAQVDDYSKDAPQPRALPDYVIGTNGTLFGPQGSCRLSATGLAEIMLMLMDGGKHGGEHGEKHGGKQILAKKTVDLMLSEQWRHNRKTGDESNGDNYKGEFQAWALGAQIFLDTQTIDKTKGAVQGDRLVEPGGFTGVGHFGDAWGLTSVIAFNRKTRDGMIFLAGGPGANPETVSGKYSSLFRYEERILTAMHRHLLAHQIEAKRKNK